MSSPDSSPSATSTFPYYTLAAIALVSCSMVIYEILLTRICALRLLFHFGFLVVSNCLLGIGASGTMISTFQKRLFQNPRLSITISAAVYLVSLLVDYAFMVLYPVSEVSFVTTLGMTDFLLFNTVAAIPFFRAGTTIGLILTWQANHVNKVYFFDLIGAALGCAFCPLAIEQFGAGGCFILISILPLAAIVVACDSRKRIAAMVLALPLAASGLALLPHFDRMYPLPGKSMLQLTANLKTVVPAKLPYSKWSAMSRIDMFPVRPQDRLIFTMGTTATSTPLPEEQYIAQDGSAGTYILNFSEHPQALELLKKSMYSAAYRLKDHPNVLVIGVGGGNDIWAAKANGAGSIKGIELNPQILEIHRSVLPNFSRNIIDDPHIHLIAGEGRSCLAAEKQSYDVIQMSGIDTWTSLVSGAYVLAENYLYTKEALATMYDRLNRDGIMEITRMAADMETLRLLSTLNDAVAVRGGKSLADSAIVLATPQDNLCTIMFKKNGFAPPEVARTQAFAKDAGIDIVYLPGHKLGTSVKGFLPDPDKASFIDRYPKNISPTSDDKPYFFHFAKWQNTASQAQIEPVQVSQGNPQFIIGQFSLSSAAAFLLTILPLLTARQSGIARLYMTQFFLYFGCLGSGFIFIEIALMQKLVLFLGHPLYSITIVLLALLTFTALGSLLSERWFNKHPERAWLIPIGLGVTLASVIASSGWIVATFIAEPFWLRILIVTIGLAPIGILLGVPFAYGIRLVNRLNPTLVPWAWAINGCLTVVGSVGIVLVSINFGFNTVLLLALGFYFLAFLAIHGLPQESGLSTNSTAPT